MTFIELFHKLLVILAITVTLKSSQHGVAADKNSVPNNGLRRLATSIDSETSYIVSFADKTISPAKQCAALAKSTGGTVLHVFDHVLNGCSLTFPAVQARMSATALSDSPAVNIVERNQDVVLLANQSEQGNIFDTTSQQLHLSAVGAPSWGLDRINQCALPLDNITTQKDASGVKVFVVDTGIYAENEEFANGAIGPADCHFSVFSGENPLTDSHGHG